ncbi:DHH family phosphoesterase [Halalkalicoccus jeotgali]|uniref:Phosphoesterase RecJ domain protein n=1 Tax=Halalkalicoccus jeotgali (strain DSM 18796 / CECT 7217 / JCM 14584 / KCTC 4019 / B3) TaxID=795797 RepID=D8J4S6_HALJB|nr:OB-fold nucleic acid binding domain-containing protein [Halalkalicoccus jeotgali]ADJ15543.1 phosphoesterase RecJ domain protein [Halalkalicoccus jeotgali B3]ELY36048.1 phosphoesterase RecJ domain-containing protein [Halalkalicoccus jeotgali B3]
MTVEPEFEDVVVSELDPACTAEDLDSEGAYLATVNGVVEYGVFVDLSEEVSGLVHESTLDEEYAVGDRLVVRLDQIRENGDIAFEPAGIDPESATVETVAHSYEITPTAKLTERESAHLEGEVVQIKQTGGPTVFQVRDGSGIVPCTAFEGAGVRAYTDVEVGDLVHVSGEVERRNGGRQVEVETLDVLEGEQATESKARLADATEERARPHEIEPLIEWPALSPMLSGLEEVAELIRRTVLEGRPVRMRHHADGDGMCAAVPVALAIERFIEEVHEDDDAAQHLLKRLPSKAPFYEMEDATRDLNYSLGDRARHGQKLPLLLMLDNGSTEEDVPAYETLAHYDIPIAAVDHHHPDPEAVEDLLAAHVNPYLHGEDYRITTGMLCVELARMIDPTITDELRHVPAVAGIADRSKADAMERYLELAHEEGYDESDLEDISEALDYAAHWLRYSAGRSLIADVLDLSDGEYHADLVDFLAERAQRDIDEQLDAAMPHLERERLDNGAHLCRIDVENHAHRFTFPAPGTTTGEIHDRIVEETGDPVITIGYGPDFAVLRSDGVRLDIPRMVSELTEEIDGGGVSGGGHLVVGSIKFVKGMREEVLDALVEKMDEAEIDEALSSAETVTDR